MLVYEQRERLQKPREVKYRINTRDKFFSAAVRGIIEKYFNLRIPSLYASKDEKYNVLVTHHTSFEQGAHIETIVISTPILPRKERKGIKISKIVNTENQIEQTIKNILFYEVGLHENGTG
jgi:hypothetical protein